MLGSNCASEDDDDIPQLSAESLSALKEFYAEQEAVRAQEEQQSGDRTEVTENWQLSQFWYDDKTAETLAIEAKRAASPNGRIACVSCPTVYTKLKELAPESQHILLEFDRRFEKFGADYIFYDYKEPLRLPAELKNSCEVVLADPPFLSEECLTNTALTIRFLSRNKIILCTGAVMEDLAQRLLGLVPVSFEPRHARCLGNEFKCYANYNMDEFVNPS